ncbi:MAG: class I SAM-dependent methyltransferase [Ginsengibacter sp.]
MGEQLKTIFERIAAVNAWGGVDSISGPGSSLVQTQAIRKEIPRILKRYSFHTMLDAPCGDLFWMKEILPVLINGGVHYTGSDIVENIIEKNKEKFKNEYVDFKCLDLSRDKISKYDLILTRDCFIHLSYHNIYLILSNYKKSGSKYLLVNTYTKKERINIDVNEYFMPGRVLNMRKFPFYFPTPLQLINEDCTEGNENEYSDKSLGLWELKKINLIYLQSYLVFGKYFRYIKRQIKLVIKF